MENQRVNVDFSRGHGSILCDVGHVIDSFEQLENVHSPQKGISVEEKSVELTITLVFR